MQADRRNKLSILERGVSAVAAAEQRALADLHRAGWQFRTIEQARAWLKAERTIQAMTTEQVIENYINGHHRKESNA